MVCITFIGGGGGEQVCKNIKLVKSERRLMGGERAGMFGRGTEETERASVRVNERQRQYEKEKTIEMKK